MQIFWQDIRLGVRMWVKRPGFAAIVILTLGLGIGANTAIFSVVNAVLLRPLPYAHPEQLVWISENNLTNNIPQEPASVPNFLDWKNQNHSFQQMVAFVNTASTLTGTGDPERFPGAYVIGDLCSTLGVAPMLGRSFLPEENTPGKNRVVILSHAFWQRRFGGDLNIIGQSITLNANPYTVIGVMPAGFKHPDPRATPPRELWLPYPIKPPAPFERRSDFLKVIARLNPGITRLQAQSEMDTIAQGLARQYPDTNLGWGVGLLSLHEKFVGDVRTALWLMMGAVGFLLLIACANIANLLLARAISREQEIAVRTALGASRRRLIWQLLTESCLLAGIGGLVGLLIAEWGTDALATLSAAHVPRLDEITLDRQVIGFTFGLSLLTGLLFGLFPALHATDLPVNEMLKESSRGTSESRRGVRIRNLLVISEIALSLVLLIGAGLMVRSFTQLQSVDPGFKPDRILTAQVLLPLAKYADGQPTATFFDQVLEHISALPGVESAGLIDTLPLSGSGNFLEFVIEHRPAPPADRAVDAEVYTISPNYFSTFNIPLVRGEGFTDRDQANTPLTVIINETMAKRIWPNENPIGQRLTVGDPRQGPWLKIIGIVKDVQHTGLDAEPYPQMYTPYPQAPSRLMSLVVRTSLDPLNLVALIKHEVNQLDRDVPLANIRTMEQVWAESLSRPRFNTWLLAIFAGLGLMLAALGIYGVISYGVSQRTHEIGIRMALGANHIDVAKLIVGNGLGLALAGILIGLIASVALTRLMSSLLFGVGVTDPLTFAAVALLLLVVALLACYLPARRAMKVDPMIALRYE